MQSKVPEDVHDDRCAHRDEVVGSQRGDTLLGVRASEPQGFPLSVGIGRVEVGSNVVERFGDDIVRVAKHFGFDGSCESPASAAVWS